LFAGRWERSVRPTEITAGAGGFVLAARTADADQSAGRTFLFIGRGPELVELAIQRVEDDASGGLLLGYPVCCIAAYRLHVGHHLTRLEPHFARAGGGPWPYWCNTLADAFGWHLVSHFPCSPGCQPTRAMARKHLAALVRFDPAFAIALRVHMQTVAFSDPARGIAYGATRDDAFGLIAAAPDWDATALEAGIVPPGAIRCDFTGRDNLDF
jgi:hypothetical protein